MLHAETMLPKFLPSYLLIVMGTMDCVTTAIGVMFYGASEMNPFLTGIVSTSIPAFLILKMSATAFIALTYFLAKKVLETADPTKKSARYSNIMLKFVYVGLLLFLFVVVANNLLVLMG